MKELSFYEQVGIVLPGAILLLGLTLLFPELKSFLGNDGVSVGGLGLFLIIAYALGHLVAAAGNLLERCVWFPASGMPSDWLTKKDTRLLSRDEIKRIEAKLCARLGNPVEISTLNSEEWRPYFRHIYRAAISAEPEGRILTFNGNYGLNRGMAAAVLLVAIVVAFQQQPNWTTWVLILGALAAVYIYRMCRSGIQFAREVFARFLQIPD